jgi:hypothetical protein
MRAAVAFMPTVWKSGSGCLSCSAPWGETAARMHVGVISGANADGASTAGSRHSIYLLRAQRSTNWCKRLHQLATCKPLRSPSDYPRSPRPSSSRDLSPRSGATWSTLSNGRLSDYSTRELQRRARAFKQELQARRPDIQIEVLDAARTTVDDGLFDLLISSPPFALDVPYADGGDVPDYATDRDRCMPAWSAELYRISNEGI